MLKQLSINLNILMAKARLSASELARKVNVPATTIKRIKNSEQTNPTIATLLPIAEYFSITLNQLIGNESLLLKSSPETINKIPLISLQNFSYPWKSLELFPQIFTERKISSEAFALLIDHTHMGEISKNSILIVEPTRFAQSGDYVAVLGNKNTLSIRNYIKEIDNIYLKPLVSGIEPSIFTSDFQILGVVIQIKKDLVQE